MSRMEMVCCDLASCDVAQPNGTDGLTMVHFAGRIYDFCSTQHKAKWEAELKKLDRAQRSRR